VLADISQYGADITVNLGDILSGPLWSAETAERLIPLQRPTIAGKHERQLLTFPREKMHPTDAHAADRITQRHRDWLSVLPTSLQLTDEIFCCHGTTDSDLIYRLETVIPGFDLQSGDRGMRRATVLEATERTGRARPAVRSRTQADEARRAPAADDQRVGLKSRRRARSSRKSARSPSASRCSGLVCRPWLVRLRPFHASSRVMKAASPNRFAVGLAPACAALIASACSSSEETASDAGIGSDAGLGDAGTHDAGANDAGSNEAGNGDAGVSDAESSDAGRAMQRRDGGTASIPTRCNGLVATTFTPVSALHTVPAGLTVPSGFTLESIAAIDGARELAALSNGDLLVATNGTSVMLIPNAEADTLPGAPVTFTSINDSPAQGIAHAADSCSI